MNKQIAYGLITIKEFDDKTRRFKGVASTTTADRMEDVVDAAGVEFRLPIPFCHQHDTLKPVGHIDKAKVVGKEIQIEGFIERFDEPPTLKERVDVAWAELKSRLVRGLSIGFNPKEWAYIKDTGGMHFTRWEWLELSMVTIPANAEATIRNIKSIDERVRMAATGRNTKASPPTSYARAGAPTQKGSSMHTYTQEALAGLQETRKTNMARMEELRELKSAESRRFTDDERSEFDALDAGIEDLDDEIRVTQRHIVNISKAKPVSSTETGRRAAPYGFVKHQDPDDKFKGQAGTRMVIAKALAAMSAREGIFVRPSEIAEVRWGKSNPQLVAVIKANEVPGGGTDSGEWGAELAQVDNRFTGDFIDFLYSKTVFDKLPLRDVPHNIAIKGLDGAFTGYWVGQSKAIPMSAGSASSMTLSPLKVAALTVLSNELIRDSSPSAERIVRDALEEALRQRIDGTFLSATAASAGVSPAGLLNGLSAIASNGTDAQSIATDFRALLAPFIAANNVRDLYIVTTPSLAASLGLMRNALGQAEFPGLTVNGGMLNGYTVVTGDNVGAGDIIMLQPSEIYKIGDLGVKISISQDATIEQNTIPTGATDTPVGIATAFTSMFQEESTAIKVVRPINFAKRRSSAVAFIGDASYGGETS